jgi:hypothetical protein
VADKEKIVNLLSVPETNIAAAAKILAGNKNRPTRYPQLDRKAFASNERAVEIVATEYQLGATSTPESAAIPTDYGKQIWALTQDATMQTLFPDE